MLDPYQAPTATSEYSSPLVSSANDGAVVSIALRIIKRHRYLLLFCYLIVWIPLDALSAYFDQFVIAEEDFRSSIRMSQRLDFWFAPITIAAITNIAIRAYDDRSPTVGNSILAGLSSYGKLWTTRFLVRLIGVFGLLLLIVPGVYFFVRAAYTDAIAVDEDSHGPTAIRRSFELTQGRFWETFRLVAAAYGVYLAVVAVSLVLIVPVFVLLDQYEWSWMLEVLVTPAVGLGTIFLNVALYCGYRKRLEGITGEALKKSARSLQMQRRVS